MRVGFTGTRKGMSIAQVFQLKDVLGYFYDVATLRRARPELHQGGAQGSDREARNIAHDFGYFTPWHPCPGVTLDDALIKECPGADFDKWLEVFPPLTRNRNIVAASFVLVAAPLTDIEELRSGTWATVRYARKANTPVIMLSRGDR